MAAKYDRREGRQVIREVSISVPERGPKEDDITPNQLAYLRRLAPQFQPEGGLESLGKWQASAVIDQIKQAKGDLDYDIATGNVHEAPGAKKKGIGFGGKLLIAFVVLAFLVIYFGSRA